MHRGGGSYPDLVRGGLYKQFVDFFNNERIFKKYSRPGKNCLFSLTSYRDRHIAEKLIDKYMRIRSPQNLTFYQLRGKKIVNKGGAIIGQIICRYIFI